MLRHSIFFVFALALFGAATAETCGDGKGPSCGSLFSKFTCGTGESCCHDSFNTWCCPPHYRCSGPFKDPGGNTHCQSLATVSEDCIYTPPKKTPIACPNPVHMEHGTVCACTSESCGSYPDPDVLAAGEALIVTSQDTREGGGFMTQQIVPTMQPPLSSAKMKLSVNAAQKFQTIIGFGGAITDAAASMYSQLTAGAQEQFIAQHYGRNGLRYELGRVPMNAADFSRRDYTFTQRNDFALSSFCLQDDTSAPGVCGQDYKVTMARAALEMQPSLKLFVSAWSAAPHYKDQNFTCIAVNGVDVCSQGGAENLMACTKSIRNASTCTSNELCEPCPATPSVASGTVEARETGWAASSSIGKGTAATTAQLVAKSLCKTPKATPTAPVDTAAGNCFNTGFLSKNATIQDSWARYFSRFISEYKKLGVPIWGLTVQNEPLTQTGLWPSMFYTAQGEADFVASFLGPTIRRDHPGTKIMVHDDSTTTLLTYAAKIVADHAAAEFIDGVAYHWYNTLEASFEDGPAAGFPFFGIDIDVGNLLNGGEDVQKLHDLLQSQSPDKFMLATEACNGFALGTDWMGPRHGDWGYGYAYSHDILWQLKNSASGWTDWNLVLNERGGPNLAGNFVDSPVWKKEKNATTFFQNPSFFHLAHFSRYIPSGSRRVGFDLDCGARRAEYCQAVAFMTPENRLVVVMTNDEINVGPVAGGGAGLGMAAMPWLARGEGSLTLGTKSLSWSIRCGAHAVSGTLPWKSIQTVVMPCSRQ